MQFQAWHIHFGRDKRAADIAKKRERAAGDRLRVLSRCEDERLQNIQNATEKRGSTLRYGDVVQLKHIRSGKYLRVDHKRFASIESHGKVCKLDSVHIHGTASCYVKLSPCFSYFSGDVTIGRGGLSTALTLGIVET